MNLIAIILAFVFTAIAALHVYWGCGGTWAVTSTLPKFPDGRPVFQASGLAGLIACLVVAFGLVAFAYACLAHVALVPPVFLAGRTKLGLLVISGIFALRTVGDFRFFGVFRRVHGTDFSRLDRLFYTPLCSVLSALLAWLARGA